MSRREAICITDSYSNSNVIRFLEKNVAEVLNLW